MSKAMIGAAILAAGLLSMGAAPAPGVRAAIYQDPPIDAAHPASGQGVQFESHGALVNAQLYQPAGEGAHPTVILLHGLPGNEQNLDLARVIQRAGWTVITFHYRGSWGSGGAFTLKGGPEDATALLELLRQPDRARAWGVDPRRIVLIGHSYGGFVAARAGAQAHDVMGVGLIAPWDVSFDTRAWSKLPADIGKATAIKALDDVDGRLGDASAAKVADQILAGADLDLAGAAPALADRPLLVLTATRDDPDDQAVDLLPALKAHGAARLVTARMETDHGFNDHRIALESAVLDWLASLPGAPG